MFVIYRQFINILVKYNISLLVKKNENVDYSYDYEYCIENNISGKIKVYTNDLILDSDLYTNSIIEKRNIFEMISYLLYNSI